jgi:hypothetical protein
MIEHIAQFGPLTNGPVMTKLSGVAPIREPGLADRNGPGRHEPDGPKDCCIAH